MSGHSKWAQIKHKKALTDVKKGKLFSKLAREISLAARIGGPSPEGNTRLKTAVLRAHAFGLPKENIGRAIKRARGGDEGELQEFLYEASAPGGVSLLIEGITDNKNRSLAEIKRILQDYDAKLADPGSIIWNFEKIGVIELDKEENREKAREEIELAIIESGASDFKELGGMWQAVTSLRDLANTKEGLERQGVRARSAYHDYKAKTEVSLPDEHRQKIEELLEALTEHDDVQEVYTNLE